MSNKKFLSLANSFLSNNAVLDNENEKGDFKEKFELVPPEAMSGFRGIFGEGKLTPKEENDIQHILYDNYQPGVFSEEQVEEDYRILLRISSEIKSVNNQSILLQGERLKKAQQLLKDYKRGAFTDWLSLTYGNRQTPYSIIAYYELYNELPETMRPLLQEMPKKAAYMLAKKNGDLEKKIGIVHDYNGESCDNLVMLIQESFKPNTKTKNQTANESAINLLSSLVDKLEQRVAHLTKEDKEHLIILIDRLMKIID